MYVKTNNIAEKELEGATYHTLFIIMTGKELQ